MATPLQQLLHEDVALSVGGLDPEPRDFHLAKDPGNLLELRSHV